MVITFCSALISVGILFLIVGAIGKIGLKISRIGYFGGFTGLILIIIGLLLQMVGFC